MTDREYVIMCGGYYEHFDRPKALMIVNGETIVGRTIRLLLRLGVQLDHIHISGTDERLYNFGVSVLRHTNTHRWEDGQIKGYWLDAFYPHFKDGTKVTYLYGDVMYTEGAIKTILECEVPGNILFGTRAAKNSGHKNWGEPFAYKVDNYREFMDGVSAVKKMWDEGYLLRHPITWELYRYLNGLDVNVQAVSDDTYICIDDGTMDIDAPWVIEKAEEKRIW